MVRDFRANRVGFWVLIMSFWRTDHTVCWQRRTPSKRAIHALVGEGNDLMPILLEEFAALFIKPCGLPPVHNCDHHIHLESGINAVAVWPYRYPQLQKDELERQCKEMMVQGIIRMSTLKFPSPVLLVKRQDNSWRFYVDYRALNEKTVKDKFPILVVEELLDELRGVFFLLS